MKSYWVADSDAVFRKGITFSKWHACTMSNGKWVCVVELFDLTEEESLVAAGAVKLADLHDPVNPISPDASAMVPPEHGLKPNDVGWSAATKLHAGLKFPPLDPKFPMR